MAQSRIGITYLAVSCYKPGDRSPGYWVVECGDGGGTQATISEWLQGPFTTQEKAEIAAAYMRQEPPHE